MKEYSPIVKNFIKEFIDNIIRYSKESKDISNKMKESDPSEKEFIDNSKRILRQVKNDKDEFAELLLIEINKLQRIDYYRIAKMFNSNSKKSKFREIISLALNGNLEKAKRKKMSDKLASGPFPLIDTESELADFEYDDSYFNINH